MLTTAPRELLDLGQQLNLNRKLVDQYFGVWAIEPQKFAALVNYVRSVKLVAHIKDNQAAYQALGPEPQASSDRKPYELTRDGVALISIDGPIQKYAGSLSGATSAVRVRRQLDIASRDDDVAAVLLTIDSPGGTIAGLQDLAETVVQVRQRKRVWALVEDMTASAAYWVASQAERIYANQPTAVVGSIGVFSVLSDLSLAAEKLGVKVHVVRSGKFKGAGTPGTPIDDEILAETQRIVDAVHSEFLAAVSSGRKMPRAAVEAIADGRLHPATEAAGLGLIDGVQDLGRTVAELVSSLQSSSRGKPKMTTENTTPAPQVASLAELKAAFPTASAEFFMSQLEAAATLPAAATAFAALQAKENETLRQQLQERDEKLAKMQERQQSAGRLQLPGVAPLQMDSGGDAGGEPTAASTDPVEAFDRLVRARMQSHNLGRRDACLAIAREQPAIHQAFLLATNSGRKAQRLIAEKYEPQAS